MKIEIVIRDTSQIFNILKLRIDKNLGGVPVAERIGWSRALEKIRKAFLRVQAI